MRRESTLHFRHTLDRIQLFQWAGRDVRFHLALTASSRTDWHHAADTAYAGMLIEIVMKNAESALAEFVDLAVPER
ncbi:MAG: hypothetical protein P8J37_09905 [Fuerstiella sp.]|jgi:hypothetical protein|nr:hypothetical protein [Fuerstiella sp.]